MCITNPFARDSNHYLVREPMFPIQPPKDKKQLDFDKSFSIG